MKEVERIDRTLNDVLIEVRATHDNQAQIIPALVTIYQALETIAKAQNIELPAPICDMSLETTP
jgi:hypothetical protein